MRTRPEVDAGCRQLTIRRRTRVSAEWPITKLIPGGAVARSYRKAPPHRAIGSGGMGGFGSVRTNTASLRRRSDLKEQDFVRRRNLVQKGRQSAGTRPGSQEGTLQHSISINQRPFPVAFLLQDAHGRSWCTEGGLCASAKTSDVGGKNGRVAKCFIR